MEELDQKRKIAIFEAAFEVFGENNYKNASTALIASKACISKGLLFYYFKNKKQLYMETFAYAQEKVKDYVHDETLFKIEDFFVLMQYAAKKKTKMLADNPYLMAFIVRSFYTQKEEVTGSIEKQIQDGKKETFKKYFSNINRHKFKDGVDPYQIYLMLVWMTDGYLHEKQMNHLNIDVSEIMTEFEKWVVMFKAIAYKEEFQ